MCTPRDSDIITRRDRFETITFAHGVGLVLANARASWSTDVKKKESPSSAIARRTHTIQTRGKNQEFTFLFDTDKTWARDNVHSFTATAERTSVRKQKETGNKNRSLFASFRLSTTDIFHVRVQNVNIEYSFSRTKA
jgi:hypothetical protein